MTVTTDYEKMLQAIAEEEPLPCTPLAVMPFFYVGLRKHTEADAGQLPTMAAVVIRYIDQLDRTLGGEGVIFDERGTVESENRLTIRLVMKSGGGAFHRIPKILDTLSSLAWQAKSPLVEQQDRDINAKIVAELESIPREVAEHLEPVAAGSV